MPGLNHIVHKSHDWIYHHLFSFRMSKDITFPLIATYNFKWISWGFLCPQLRRSWGGILVWACPSDRLSVCPSVRLSVTPYVGCKTRERLELGTWNFIYSISTKNKQTRIFFFFGRPLYGKVMPLFRLSHKNLVNTITWEWLELGFSYLAYGLGSMFRWPD